MSEGKVSAAKLVIDEVKAFYAAREKAKGRGKRILYELERNHVLISNWEKSRGDISTIIQQLSISEFEKSQHAFRSSDVRMRKITKKSITSQPYRNRTWCERYIGWGSEQIIRRIYRKILELKDIELRYPTNPKFRKSVRLININRLLTLLSIHLRS